MINGKTIYLRAIGLEDNKFFNQWINDSETNYWRGLYHPMSIENSLEWLKQNSVITHEKICFAVCDNQHNFIGLIGLRSICLRSRRGEIWIYLGNKEKWGHGIGSDAIKTLCDYSFNQMNLNRIWAEIDPENMGTLRCLEKSHFTKEGVLRAGYYRHGKYRDTMILSILRKEWDCIMENKNE
jgi:RimJ/RimL family protein N-acetyltransferase